MKYATPGSVSHGTMRAEDLLDAFSSTLEDLVQQNAEEWCSDHGRVRRDDYLALIGIAREPDSDAPDALAQIVFDLFDALNDFAPEGYHFGAHPGDGADYGFWPTEE